MVIPKLVSMHGHLLFTKVTPTEVKIFKTQVELVGVGTISGVGNEALLRAFEDAKKAASQKLLPPL